MTFINHNRLLVKRNVGQRTGNALLCHLSLFGNITRNVDHSPSQRLGNGTGVPFVSKNKAVM